MAEDIIRADGFETKEAPKSCLCKPHRCDLNEGHQGKHVCDCGKSWRNLDAPKLDVAALLGAR